MPEKTGAAGMTEELAKKPATTDQKSISEKLLRWLIFSVLIGVCPLLVSGLNLATRGGEATLASLIGRGELLLIAAAMCAGAIGELIAAGTRKLRTLKILACGFAIIIVLVSSLYFADVSAAYQANTQPKTDLVLTTSLWLFVCGLVSSGSCIALAEV